MKTLFLVFVFFILSIFLSATIINIPADQPTIQEGINVSVNGDTVLVQPDTYVENINYNGKNITVASLFLTTQDTTYISSTIIDGGQPSNPDSASVVTFKSGENSFSILSGFTIRNGSGTYADPSGSGYYHYLGGGIFCLYSNPSLENLQISENTVERSGAGIYFYNSDVNLSNSVISNNTAEGKGGGICCIENSNLNILNTKIINNSSGSSGGGIFFQSGSNSLLQDVVILENTAEGSGGGICSYATNPIMENVLVSNNVGGWSGGGIFWYNTDAILSNVTISENTADGSGGGIYSTNSTINFNMEDRCNIYSNNAQFGNDLCNYSENIINVIVDTFTVMMPTNFHAYPIDNFTFDILHGMLPQVNADLYVSPDGDNSNSGLSWADPLKTIYYALSIIYADSLDPHTIYLDSGIFSLDTNGESFPVICTSWVSFSGTDENLTIIDADMEDRVVFCIGSDGVNIEELTLTNGHKFGDGGGIYCENSNLNLTNLTVSNCSAGTAGGIYHTNSNSVFNNITVINNAAKHYGGIYSNGSTLSIIGSDILANYAEETAGGIYCKNIETDISSTNIIGNFAGYNGGGMVFKDSDPELQNVLISENTAFEGGGINCRNSNPTLENVTISYNNANYSGGGICCDEDSSPVFSENNRCNIYMNTSPIGNDLYSQEMMNVIVDTFTVMIPTGFHASPIDNFTFDILHGMLPQVNADLYVSPDGNNSNSGTSPDDPLRTIIYALSVIYADSLNQHTIFLLPGIFSPSTNGEQFPLPMSDYVSLQGNSQEDTFLDADNLSGILRFDFVTESNIRNITVRNGNIGIYFDNSSPSLENVIITSNSDGGIKCSHNSNPILINTTISHNWHNYYGGAITCFYGSHPILVNSILWNNFPQEIEFYSWGEPNSITIAYSDIQGGEAGIVTNNNGSVNWLEGNIDVDPLFADPQNGNYQLTEDSPCIDAGTAFFEWQGNIIVNMTPDEYYGPAPDMGAYEWEGVNNENQQIIPIINKLYGNYPNPFNPETTISFNLTTELTENTEIIIYNIKGQKVRTLHPFPNRGLGTRRVVWNGTDDNGKNVSSGIYFYKLKVDDKTFATKKCLLLK